MIAHRPFAVTDIRARLQRSDLDDSVLGSIEREAGSMSVGYRQKQFRYAGKLEVRRDRGDVDRTQWLTTNQA